MRAFIVGSSLMIYQAINEPRTVSKGIIIPTSAAGIYLGAKVTKLNDIERNVLKNAMLAISQIEISVKKFWTKLGERFPKAEFEQEYLTFVLWVFWIRHNQDVGSER